MSKLFDGVYLMELLVIRRVYLFRNINILKLLKLYFTVFIISI